MGDKFILILITLLLTTGCKHKNKGLSWSSQFPAIGTNSSPRLVDLTEDGILDIVIGAGGNEGDSTDYGVLALNGASGQLLWRVSAGDQIVGSAIFLDATFDGIPDVFIGGRNANLLGIDGKNGTVLWRYNKSEAIDGLMQYAQFNFYTPQIVPDQNEDGVPDLLVANGGNVSAAAHSRQSRFPGVLMVLDSSNGAVLAVDTVPDGNETYMSPLVNFQDDPGDPEIIFGTGGETIGGALYRARLSDLKKGELHRATELLRTDGHGFVAPPVWVDITGDHLLDIVGHQHGGTIYAIDGSSDTLLWKLSFPEAEANSTPAPGYFNEDEFPDLFCHLSIGAWPENRGTFQVLVDGLSGEVLFQDTLGCTGFYSPVAYDLDQDGYDEALLPINEYNCASRLAVTDIQHQLKVFDFQKNQTQGFGPVATGKNISSTPWIGDVDQDGMLDIVYSLQANTSVLLEFFGMSVIRESTKIPVGSPVRWGAYLGSNYDGIFNTGNNGKTPLPRERSE